MGIEVRFLPVVSYPRSETVTEDLLFDQVELSAHLASSGLDVGRMGTPFTQKPYTGGEGLLTAFTDSQRQCIDTDVFNHRLDGDQRFMYLRYNISYYTPKKTADLCTEVNRLSAPNSCEEGRYKNFIIIIIINMQV